MSGMARPVRKKTGSKRPSSRLRRGGGGRPPRAGPPPPPPLGPEGGPSSPGVFADLETGPDEFEDEADDDPLLGPAIISDPYAARPFSPVDDPRLAALLDPEIERSLKVGRIPSMA